MKVQIEITCDNAALAPEPGRELASILRDLAKRFEGGRVKDADQLRDDNGNTVGRVAISD